MSMPTNHTWKTVFANWPESLPRRGIVISSLNESIPFKGFMVKEDTLLFERTNTDAQGARFILIGFDAINNVKFTDPLKESVFTGAGYVGKFSGT